GCAPRQEPMVPRPRPPAIPPPRPVSTAQGFAPMAQAQTDSDPPSVPELENRATVQRARPSWRALARESLVQAMARDERPDTGELRATEVRGAGPRVVSGPGAPTLQGSAPGRGDTEPQDAGPDFVESPSELLTPITHRLATPRPMPSPTVMGVGASGPSVQKDPFDDQTAVASPSEALLRA